MGDDPNRNYVEQMRKLGWDPSGPYELESSTPHDSADLRPTIMVCEVCGVLLNQWQNPYGERQYIHAKGWQKYDHDPVPVEQPRDEYEHRICDFCGRDREVNWQYTGNEIRQRVGNLDNNYGHIWAGCDACDEYVREGDIDRLVDRVMRVSPMFSKQNQQRDGIRKALRELHGEFVPSINERKWMGPPVLPARLTPRLMPKIAQGLVKYWSHPRLYQRLIKPGFQVSVPGVVVGEDDAFRITYPEDGELIPRDVFLRHTARLGHAIELAAANGEMYWIASDFTTLAVAAGQELTDLALSPSDMPSPQGVIVWEDPIGEIKRPQGVAAIRCMSWTTVRDGVQINVYIQGEDADPDMRGRLQEMREEWGHMMAPNLGAGLPFKGWEDETVSEEFRHTGNFLLTLLSTWFLINQPGVAEETIVLPEKKVQRAYRRSGKRIPEVKLIDLRRHHGTAEQPIEAVASGRKISVRFMVRGHWKRQAYGPKRGLRRQIYVAPFMKGPDGAPLKVTTPVVKVLR